MRQTTNKNLTKQILTLMLAFVMVFTGMGIGSWGVETAWADGTAAKPTIELLADEVSGYLSVDEVEHQIGEETVAKTYQFAVVGDDFIIKNSSGKKLMKSSIRDINGVSAAQAHFNKDTEVEVAGWSGFAADEQQELIKKEYLTEQSASKVYFIYFRSLSYAVLIEVLPETEIKKEDLADLVKKAEGLTEEDYYPAAKYNGQKYSKNGFWSEMQTSLAKAKALFVDSSAENDLAETTTDAQIIVAYTKLNSSINALVPVSQADTTSLYEALKQYEAFDLDIPYEEGVIESLQEKRAEAQELMNSLFENGKATEANSFVKQEEINRIATELKELCSADLDAYITNQSGLTAFLTRAKAGMKGVIGNDLTLSGYETVSQLGWSFAGILDGNGHKITVDQNFRGLVGSSKGEIKNIEIAGDKIIFTDKDRRLGLIASTNNGIIENCSNSVDLEFTASSTMVPITNIGGICYMNNGTIRKCSNSGNLTFITAQYPEYLAGVCSINKGKVMDCYNSGNLVAYTKRFLKSGGIVGENQSGGTVQYCYNSGLLKVMEPWVEPTGHDYEVGTFTGLGFCPIVGRSVGGDDSVSDCYYLDTIAALPENGKITAKVSDIYLTKAGIYNRYVKNIGGEPTVKTPYLGTIVLGVDDTTFAEGDYYLYFDVTNDHFIAVRKSADATSNEINAKTPSDVKTSGRMYRGMQKGYQGSGGADGEGYVEKDIYLVEVPENASNVVFTGSEEILDPTCGMNNLYGDFYNIKDSSNMLGTKYIDDKTSEEARKAIKARWPEKYDEIFAAFGMKLGSKYRSKDNGGTGGEQKDTVNVTFRLIGATKSTSGNYDVGKGVKDSEYINWIKTKSYSLKKGSTVGDLFKKACDEAGLSYEGLSTNYISSITAPSVLGGYWLGEFTNGTRSGWMYTVNGKHPNVGLNACYLGEGDTVIWHYINDYSYECSDWFDDTDYPNLGDATTFDPWLKAADVRPSAGMAGGAVEDTKNVTTDTKTGTTTAPTEVKVSEKTAADGTKTKVAEVKVSADNQKEVLKQAKASKSKEIILNVSKSSVGDATKADVTLDKSFIDSILKDTDANLTIKTPFGDKTYTQEELKAMSAAATGSTVTVAVEKAAQQPTDDTANAEKIAKAKAIVKDMKLVARSGKTAKKNIKAVLKSDSKVNASIKELKDLGFTVKYRFYRSTKKAASYKSTVTKNTATYTNTSGKKGTKYFYKVQVRFYDENGKLVAKTALKQCKYASRTWSK